MRSPAVLLGCSLALLAAASARADPLLQDLAPFATIEVAPFSVSSFGFSELDKGPGAVRDDDPKTAWEVPAEEGATATLLLDWSTEGGIDPFPITSLRIDIDPPDAPIRLLVGPDQGTLAEAAFDAKIDAAGVTLTPKETPSLRVLQGIFPAGARVSRLAVFGGPETGTLGPIQATCDGDGVHLAIDGTGLLAVEATRELPAGGAVRLTQRRTAGATLGDASVRFDPRPTKYAYSVRGIGSADDPIPVEVTCSGEALNRPAQGPVHGVIEGFYGRPWTWHEREKVVLAMGALGMDTYIYAPKQDPFHRDAWRDPYDDDAMAHFKALSDLGRGVGVNVVWAISPGKDIDPEDPADVTALLDKVGSMSEKAGIRDAALLMDDLSKAHTAALGQAHADLATKLLDAMLARDAASRLWFVPTVYAGLAGGLSAGDIEYLTALSTLPLSVPLAWTGAGVFSQTITLDDATAFGALAGKDPSGVFVWDNYPVNDLEVLRSLHTHPITGRETLLPETGGLLTNPMRHALASLPAIASYAELALDPVQYTIDRGQGAPLRTAALALVLADAEAPPRALADLFAEMVHHDTLWPDEKASPALTKALEDHAAATPGEARRDAALALATLLGRLAIADVDLRRDLADTALADEIDAYARATQAAARAALFALSAERERELGADDRAKADEQRAACLWLAANQPSWRTIQDAIAPLIPTVDAPDCPAEDAYVGPYSRTIELGQRATFDLPGAFSEKDTTAAIVGPDGAALSGTDRFDWTPPRLGRFRFVSLRSGDAGVSASIEDVLVVEKLPVTPDPEATDPGCGCRTTPRSGGAPGGLFLVLAALLGARLLRTARRAPSSYGARGHRRGTRSRRCARPPLGDAVPTLRACLPSGATGPILGGMETSAGVIRTLVQSRGDFLAFVEKRVGRRDLAEDILQEAFARGIDRAGALANDASATAWFYRTLRNAVIDRHRRRGAEDRALAAFAAELETHDPESEAPPGNVCQCVSQLTSTLKPEYADALHRIEVDGLTVKAYAEEHGLTANNAAVRVFRAREALRKKVHAACGACADEGCLHCNCSAPAPDIEPKSCCHAK